MTCRSGRRAPGGGHRITDLKGEVELGGGEGFRAVFEHPFGFRTGVGHQLPQQAHRRDGHVYHLGLAHPEDGVAKRLRCGVVDMHDGPACTLEGVDGAADQVLARLRQHLDGDVVGDVVALDQLADEVEVGLRGGREGDLDLLETDLAERANMRILRSAFIGSKSAWLPSRRSVLIQIGGALSVRPGHCRSASWTAGKGVYLREGLFNMIAGS
jgi:hypothetical protein